MGNDMEMLRAEIGALNNQVSMLNKRILELEKAEALRRQGEAKLRKFLDQSIPSLTIRSMNPDGSSSLVARL